jgi:hypothetical protein
MDRALKAIEGMRLPPHHDLERLFVIVPACFASSHTRALIPPDHGGVTGAAFVSTALAGSVPGVLGVGAGAGVMLGVLVDSICSSG